MKLFIAVLFSIFLLAFGAQAASPGNAVSQLQADVEDLFQPGRDLAEIKLSIDRMVDPSVNTSAGLAAIDRMAASVKAMLPDEASSSEKLAALKRYVYEAGTWNDGKPFQYDLSDPLGEKPASRKLIRYLETRRGNCITMPILFLLLGERLGLRMTLAEAPLHLFVKYTDDGGQTWNLEATSGAGFTRDLWYRQKLPMTDIAVENGVYLRALSRDEMIATMAAFLIEHHLETGSYEEAIAVADVLLRYYPNSTYVLAKKGTAYYRLLEREVIGKYTRAEDIPPDLRTRADIWYRENTIAFDRAEALGWRPVDGQMQ